MTESLWYFTVVLLVYDNYSIVEILLKNISGYFFLETSGLLVFFTVLFYI